MLRNTIGAGRVSYFLEKRVTKMNGSILLAYEGVNGCQISRKISLRNT